MGAFSTFIAPTVSPPADLSKGLQGNVSYLLRSHLHQCTIDMGDANHFLPGPACKYFRQSATHHPEHDKLQDYLPIGDRWEVMISHSEKQPTPESGANGALTPRPARIEMNAGSGSRCIA